MKVATTGSGYRAGKTEEGKELGGKAMWSPNSDLWDEDGAPLVLIFLRSQKRSPVGLGSRTPQLQRRF